MLYNKIDKKLLKTRVQAETFARQTYGFYRYVPIDDVATFRDTLYAALADLSVLGRIYLATEGINAQCSVPIHRIDDFRALLQRYDILKDITLQQALDEKSASFHKLAIKIRPELVTTALKPHETAPSHASPKLDPLAFHNALDDEKTLVVDVRNHYEHEVGRFENALCFPSDTFRDLLPELPPKLENKQDHTLLLYCTGGIRCEKASAYLKHHGFSHIYQLKGGIVGYAQAIRTQQLTSKFKGKNFVFDNRLGERISPDILSQCHQCSTPCDTHANCCYEDCHLLFIQCPTCRDHFNGCCSYDCKQKSALPLAEQRKLRRGHLKPNALSVHKSRSALKKIDARTSDPSELSIHR